MSDVRKWLDGFDPEGEHGMLTMDGFDDCIIGVVRQFQNYVVLYDPNLVIEKLMSNGMSYDEAVEYFEFNQVGSWLGPKTPAFFYRPITEDQEELE